LALFQGRVIDKPEVGTTGEVEHSVIMIGGILFFVIEAKSNKPTNNDLAQLFSGAPIRCQSEQGEQAS